MTFSVKALYDALVRDLSPFLDRDQQIAAYMRSSTIPVYPDDEMETHAAVHLLNNALKKCVTEKSDGASAKALEVFHESNGLCGTWELSAERSLHDDLLWGHFRMVVDRVFGHELLLNDNLCDLFDRGALGPGVQAGCRDTALFKKLFDARLTASSASIFELFSRCVVRRPRWQSSQFVRQLQFGIDGDIVSSKISFVNKSNDTDRTICAEPTLNMWFQQGLGSVFEDVLRSQFSIDLSNQQVLNRSLALNGVRCGFATIDLKSASDSMSLRMLRSVLPRHVMAMLETLRSREAKLPSGELVRLNMVSTMGNGFTFPLQTLVFSCVVQAVFDMNGYQLSRNICRGKQLVPGNFGVFGDDIIVPAYAFRDVCRLLKILGFRLNEAKSFSEGPFRESCGLDSYNGHNIRPVYLRDQSRGSLYSFLNQIRMWSARLNIGLNQTIFYLARTLPRVLVPRSFAWDSGIQVPSCMVSPPNPHGHFIFSAFEPKVDRAVFLFDKWRVPDAFGRWSFNSDGVVLCILNGGLVNGSMALRPHGQKVSYHLRKYASPNWDGFPLGLDLLDRAAWARWSSESVRLLTRV